MLLSQVGEEGKEKPGGPCPPPEDVFRGNLRQDQFPATVGSLRDLPQPGQPALGGGVEGMRQRKQVLSFAPWPSDLCSARPHVRLMRVSVGVNFYQLWAGGWAS